MIPRGPSMSYQVTLLDFNLKIVKAETVKVNKQTVLVPRPFNQSVACKKTSQ